ncbi:hypothetical protein BgiMline_034799, partial [Biomphalaria glabrata]
TYTGQRQTKVQGQAKGQKAKLTARVVSNLSGSLIILQTSLLDMCVKKFNDHHSETWERGG